VLGRPPVAGKNGLGLGPNATGIALFGVFLGVYYTSSYLTKSWVMRQNAETEKPVYFRDLNVVTTKHGDDDAQVR